MAYTERARARFGDRLVSVVLFGSCARGAATASSDIDLLLVAEGLPTDRLARQEINIRLSRDLEPLLDDIARETTWYPYLSVILETPAEARRFHRIYLDMVEEARLLYDRDGFFASVLETVKRPPATSNRSTQDDVGKVLRDNVAKLPSSVREMVDEISRIPCLEGRGPDPLEDPGLTDMFGLRRQRGG